jgi:hypothetical protein
MREIKFRFFINGAKEMHYPDSSWYISGNGQLVIIDDFGSHLPDPFQGGTVLMQFTGLKDKTGKEIYEGDIVISDTFPEEVGVHKGIVEFKEVEGCFETDNAMFMNLGGSNFTRVIGNIYENKELL